MDSYAAKQARRRARPEQSLVVTECGGYTVARNLKLNRLDIKFPGKPPESVIRLLWAAGFRWSPTEGAWQRVLNETIGILVTEGYLRRHIEAHLTSQAARGKVTS